MEATMQKPALKSKKFWAFLLSLLTCASLLAGLAYASADVWVLRTLAGGLVVIAVGYVLGVVALERVLVRGAAIVRPEADDHLDKETK